MRGVGLMVGLVWTALSLRAAAEAPKYVIEAADGQRIAATLTFRVECPAMDVKQWTFFVPQAPELPSQTLVKTTTDPKGTTTADGRIGGRKVVVVRRSGKGAEHAAEITIRYEALLRRRRLEELAAGGKAPEVADLVPRDRRMLLASTPSVNHAEPAFAEHLKEAGLVRVEGEAEIDFARRVFDHGRMKGSYQFEPATERTALAVAEHAKSDCCGWSNWFVAVMRSGGVPARSLVGRWARSAEPQGRLEGKAYQQQHIRAEFFARGVGWVPVDLSQAIVRGRRGARCFGTDDGDFFTMHADVDFSLIPPGAAKRNYSALQSPAWWATGSGKVENTTTRVTWNVEEAASGEK